MIPRLAGTQTRCRSGDTPGREKKGEMTPRSTPFRVHNTLLDTPSTSLFRPAPLDDTAICIHGNTYARAAPPGRTTPFLGDGAFGDVHAYAGYAGNVRHSLAVKTFKPSVDHAQKRFQKELAILKTLRGNPHPNICRLVASSSSNDASARLWIAFELCERDLYTVVMDANFDKARIPAMARDIFKGVNHLHTTCHVAHRDLKPENILVTTPTRGAELALKICDFGLAVHFDCDSATPSAPCGTNGYRAPEVSRAVRVHWQKCDMWSLGVVLLVSFFGLFPFTNLEDVASCPFFVEMEQQQEMSWMGNGSLPSRFRDMAKQKKVVLPSTVDDRFIRLIDTMLITDPSRRASIDWVVGQIEVNDDVKRKEREDERGHGHAVGNEKRQKTGNQ